jgi:hypothetical protein
MQVLTDGDLAAKTIEFKERLSKRTRKQAVRRHPAARPSQSRHCASVMRLLNGIPEFPSGLDRLMSTVVNRCGWMTQRPHD